MSCAVLAHAYIFASLLANDILLNHNVLSNISKGRVECSLGRCSEDAISTLFSCPAVALLPTDLP